MAVLPLDCLKWVWEHKICANYFLWVLRMDIWMESKLGESERLWLKVLENWGIFTSLIQASIIPIFLPRNKAIKRIKTLSIVSTLLNTLIVSNRLSYRAFLKSSRRFQVFPSHQFSVTWKKYFTCSRLFLLLELKCKAPYLYSKFVIF